MNFKFSSKITLRCLVLIVFMLIMAAWQWRRHQAKLLIVEEFNKHLAMQPVPLEQAIKEVNFDYKKLIHRRVYVEGDFKFEDEIVIRNRRFDGMPGMLAVTPMKLNALDENSEGNNFILVNRGFIPLQYATKEERKIFQKQKPGNFLALIQESEPRKPLSPRDQEPTPEKRVDVWLRFDIAHIQKEMPYKLLPIYLEVMGNETVQEIKEKIIPKKSGEDEILSLTDRGAIKKLDMTKYNFPVPLYNTIVPAGRHLGYVYQWSFMALLVAFAGFVLQMRR